MFCKNNTDQEKDIARSLFSHLLSLSLFVVFDFRLSVSDSDELQTFEEKIEEKNKNKNTVS